MPVRGSSGGSTITMPKGKERGMTEQTQQGRRLVYDGVLYGVGPPSPSWRIPRRASGWLKSYTKVSGGTCPPTSPPTRWATTPAGPPRTRCATL